jgi:DNA-binding transcriptional MerR regulator
MGIGELAQRSGVSVAAIRFYEDVGLLPLPKRRANGHRMYATDVENRLNFIRRCRSFGFSLTEIKELAAVMKSEDRSCFEARDLAAGHLANVRKSLLELRALKKDLRRFVAECEAQCSGGVGKDCRVLGKLTQTRSVPHGEAAVLKAVFSA